MSLKLVRAIALVVFTFSSQNILAVEPVQLSPVGEPPGGQGKKYPGQIINMLDYLVPEQRVNDQKPFHLTGYSKCFWGDCVQRGEPAYAEGGFFKVYRLPEDESADVRYVSLKAPYKPAEYSIVKKEYEYGQWVLKSYLEAEDMDWSLAGWELRDYHDASGYPTFEWGRSNAAQGETYLQVIPWCTWRYCGAGLDRRELSISASVYTVQEFILSDDLRGIVARLGDRVFDDDMTGLLIRWIALSKVLNLGRPRLLVISGYWSPVAAGITQADPALWYQREIYSYLEGIGWVGWWWQNHVGQGQNAPFSTMKGGAMTTLIWEDPRNPILAYDVCAKLPSGYPTPIIPKR